MARRIRGKTKRIGGKQKRLIRNHSGPGTAHQEATSDSINTKGRSRSGLFYVCYQQERSFRMVDSGFSDGQKSATSGRWPVQRFIRRHVLHNAEPDILYRGPCGQNISLWANPPLPPQIFRNSPYTSLHTSAEISSTESVRVIRAVY